MQDKYDNDNAATKVTVMNHQLMAIELDPAVVQVAKQYFGAAAAPRAWQ
jgi:spermidine synthase